MVAKSPGTKSTTGGCVRKAASKSATGVGAKKPDRKGVASFKGKVTKECVKLSEEAWYWHIKGDPLNLASAGSKVAVYEDFARLAPEKEEYTLYGPKVTKHCSRHFVVDKKYLGRIEQRLGSTAMQIHGPPTTGRDRKKFVAWSQIQNFASYINQEFPAAAERNLCVIKNYRDGNEMMGAHDDGASVRATPVASLSVGATRRLIVRAKKKSTADAPRPKWVVALGHGDIFVMCGAKFQVDFTHELPPEKGCTEGRCGVVLRERKLDPKAPDAERKAKQAVEEEKNRMISSPKKIIKSNTTLKRKQL